MSTFFFAPPFFSKIPNFSRARARALISITLSVFIRFLRFLTWTIITTLSKSIFFIFWLIIKQTILEEVKKWRKKWYFGGFFWGVGRHKNLNFIFFKKQKKLLLDNVAIMIYVENLRNRTKTDRVIDISARARARAYSILRKQPFSSEILLKYSENA